MAITIVGLGPGEGHLLTREAWQLLSSAPRIYLRTARHPAVADLPATVERVTFDAIYESAATFAEVYEQIVAEVLRLGREAASTASTVIYAVPGHPFVGEATVRTIVGAAASEGLAVTVLPGLSFVEPTLAAVGIDGLEGLQLFDAIELAGYNHPPLNPNVPLLLGQIYSRLLAGELKLALMALYPDEHEVTLIHGAATDAQQCEIAPLYTIDRSDRIGHLTSLYVPPLPYVASLAGLAETVATLRGPEGCPWDQEQTPQSMRADFQEEVAEALDALDSADGAGLREELGDVLYHLVMQAQMASESGDFGLTDVIAGIDAKLKRRHPHVWGDWQVSDSDEVVRNWRQLKRQEKGMSGRAPDSVLDNIPRALPALARSQKIQQRVRRIGFDWPDIGGVMLKLEEELAELKTAESTAGQMAELGDVLFVLVNWASWLNVDAETALREANLRFCRRFQRLEQLATERSLQLETLGLAALDGLWNEVKLLLANETDNRGIT
jgi:tetrapyrrole methylase family protein / MazG family protein